MASDGHISGEFSYKRSSFHQKEFLKGDCTDLSFADEREGKVKSVTDLSDYRIS